MKLIPFYITVSMTTMYDIGFNPKYLPHNIFRHLVTDELDIALQFYQKYRHLNNEYYILKCLGLPPNDKYQCRVIEIFNPDKLDKLLCLV